MKKKSLFERIAGIAYPLLFLTSFLLLVITINFHLDEAWQYVSAFSILALSIIGAIYPLLKKDRITLSEKLIVCFCFVFLLAEIIVFASLSTGQLREPIIQISAALLGGGLTLYGVGITIKSNRLDREQYEIEKAKPNVFPISEKTWKQLNKDRKIEYDVVVREDLSSLKEPNQKEESYSFAPLCLANSDLSMCTLKGIVINQLGCIVFQFDNVIQKGSNSRFKIDYSFACTDKIESIKLILGDMYGNTYYRDFSFEIENKSPKKKTIVITGALDFVDVSPIIKSIFAKNPSKKPSNDHLT